MAAIAAMRPRTHMLWAVTIQHLPESGFDHVTFDLADLRELALAIEANDPGRGYIDQIVVKRRIDIPGASVQRT